VALRIGFAVPLSGTATTSVPEFVTGRVAIQAGKKSPPRETRDSKRVLGIRLRSAQTDSSYGEEFGTVELRPTAGRLGRCWPGATNPKAMREM
jgi:hypothetical protein